MADFTAIMVLVGAGALVAHVALTLRVRSRGRREADAELAGRSGKHMLAGVGALVLALAAFGATMSLVAYGIGEEPKTAATDTAADRSALLILGFGCVVYVGTLIPLLRGGVYQGRRERGSYPVADYRQDGEALSFPGEASAAPRRRQLLLWIVVALALLAAALAVASGDDAPSDQATVRRTIQPEPTRTTLDSRGTTFFKSGSGDVRFHRIEVKRYSWFEIARPDAAVPLLEHIPGQIPGRLDTTSWRDSVPPCLYEGITIATSGSWQVAFRPIAAAELRRFTTPEGRAAERRQLCPHGRSPR